MIKRFLQTRALERRSDTFWKWFQENSDDLLIMGGRELVESRLISTQLEKVQKGLVIEVDGPEKSPRELVISADGSVSRFDAVEAVVDRAPQIPGWRFVRFRQRQAGYERFSIKLGGQTISAADIQYSVSSTESHVDVELFIPGCPREPSRPFIGIGFLLIDSAIGEYDATIKLGKFKIMGFEEPGSGHIRHPFTTFREQFDAAFERNCCKNP